MITSLQQLLDTEWKFTAFSIVVSLVITAILTQVIFGQILPTALAIAVACATPASYFASRAVLSRERMIVHQRDELQRLNEELQERNADLDAYAHTVAHDLKNPLGVIKNYTDLLVSMDLPPEKRDDFLEKIIRNVDTSAEIIDSLLLLSQVRNTEVEQERIKDMEALVQQAWKRQQVLIEKHNATLITPDQWPTAMGYAPWVEAVWANYLSNAIKYGGEPPRVEVGAEKAMGNMIRYWVRDNGKGLTPTEQRKLFTTFSRIDTSVEGHGLGLSIAKRIVEKLGGQVAVESKRGTGCTFSFTLPAG